MNVGSLSFKKYKKRVSEFHGYPAPGLLIGGFMVTMARNALPEGTLFEAVIETKTCLPDAVQILTPCSVGNNWMKVLNLGRYALSLYDKYTGSGFRVHLDTTKFGPYPEIDAWFLKKKPKSEQNTSQLFAEIELAGESICTLTPIQVCNSFLRHSHMGPVTSCPVCGEAYPVADGIICRGCQGEAPYLTTHATQKKPMPRIISVDEAVGKTALHDMTRIIPGKSSEAAFHAGQVIRPEDIEELKKIGRFSIAVTSGPEPDGFSHENTAVEAMAKRIAGDNLDYALPPSEGKVMFTAKISGLFSVDKKRLESFNLIQDVICATRQDGMLVEAGTEVAGSRVIPLYIEKRFLGEALAVAETPLFSVLPLRKAKVGILVTGTEIYQGLVQDQFTSLVSAKVAYYACTVIKSVIAPDKKDHIIGCVQELRNAGVDLIITTGGLSVDPDDITRQALIEAGLTRIVHGAPVLPGCMTLTGFFPTPSSPPGKVCPSPLDAQQPQRGEAQLIGIPAGALRSKTTLFTALLPRLLAGRVITRQELASLGEGGLCMKCKVCTWPKCFFLK